MYRTILNGYKKKNRDYRFWKFVLNIRRINLIKHRKKMFRSIIRNVPLKELILEKY